MKYFEFLQKLEDVQEGSAFEFDKEFRRQNNPDNILYYFDKQFGDLDTEAGILLGAIDWEMSAKGGKYWINISNKLEEL